MNWFEIIGVRERGQVQKPPKISLSFSYSPPPDYYTNINYRPNTIVASLVIP